MGTRSPSTRSKSASAAVISYVSKDPGRIDQPSKSGRPLAPAQPADLDGEGDDRHHPRDDRDPAAR